MIYVKGNLWHAVRTFGASTTITLCGRYLPNDNPITDVVHPTFLCRTCALAIARSPSVVGA